MVEIDSQNNFDYKYLTEKIEQIFKEVEKEFNQGSITADIIFVDNDYIQKLNSEYREKDKVTDVLSFEMWDTINPTKTIGEVYVATDVAKNQSLEYKHSFEREILFLITHGLLHLIGYDHQTKTEEDLMIARQKEILKGVDL